MDKRSLSERDICTEFITAAVSRAGWHEMVQIREELCQTSRHEASHLSRPSQLSARKGRCPWYFDFQEGSRLAGA